MIVFKILIVPCILAACIVKCIHCRPKSNNGDDNNQGGGGGCSGGDNGGGENNNSVSIIIGCIC